ncbi:hypothetical protein [Breznakiella homolactica]|uniref:DUF5666 domain-containing protein n=1 Tax=Breznakiella homolactica TaxID=2798577 RepID=A0A7T7XQJ6_9SPIR|nr:hypothetical protein [Breznakiella homolactica]QQO10597.1 hypothetical protein JFL75_06690 [Breznakiella homolactica]
MKRIAIIVGMGLIAAGAVSAQAWGPRGTPPGPAPQVQPAETTKVSGKLALVNGMIAVQDGGTTYYVNGLGRLVGFIDGLKEGATVNLEGYAFPIQGAPEYQHLRLTSFTFNGKTYDMAAMYGPGANGPGPGMHHNPGMGMQHHNNTRGMHNGRW